VSGYEANISGAEVGLTEYIISAINHRQQYGGLLIFYKIASGIE
jgi:hypothetical protein